MSVSRIKSSLFFRVTSWIQIAVFFLSLTFPNGLAHAQSFNVFSLPKPGEVLSVSEKFTPLLIKGISLHKENPLVFDFILDPGDAPMSDDQLKLESQRLIKYFFASLTVPAKDLWVNLSPYEKDRIIPEGFGQTEMGRDLLAQDYMLKQLSASMIYPEKDLGKDFWNRVYRKAKEVYGTTDIPVNTFNKVWIMPDKAVIVETKTSAYITQSRLKVLLEEDYISLNANRASEVLGTNVLQETDVKNVSSVTSAIVRDIVLPEIEKEVNEGKNFAQLRQVYNSLLLATWFKVNLKENILNQVYSNQNKILGVDVKDKADKDKIYDRYLAAFREGVFNYIKEDVDEATKEVIPRKYFSGGFDGRELEKGFVNGGGVDRLSGETPAGKGAISAATAGGPAQVVVAVAASRPDTTSIDSPVSVELRERLLSNQSLPEVVRQNISAGVIQSQRHAEVIQKLIDIGEQDKLAKWEEAGINDEQKRAQLDQVDELERGYTGGLTAYKENVRKLLEASKKGVNPFEGFEPSVPNGDDLSNQPRRVQELAEVGLKGANRVSFVLVAGGVGDRLKGLKGVKLGIPTDLVTMKPYLQTYVESILEIQRRSNNLNNEDRKVPLTIMTSSETHDMTVQLLRDNNYFGMDGLSINPTREQVDRGDVRQIVILTQGTVPAVNNNEAEFVLNPNNSYRFQEKPHGHGDVHMLIQRAGLASYWNRQGIGQTIFFQDTNGQVFNAILPGIGNSLQKKSALNFLTVPRGAGEKAGAIVQMKYGLVVREEFTRSVVDPDTTWQQLVDEGYMTEKGILTSKFNQELVRQDSDLFNKFPPTLITFLQSFRANQSQTFNVEYNELGPFLVKTVNPNGDVADPVTGKSSYPGNLNVFIVDNQVYEQELVKTGGIFGEFINPKYADSAKTTFSTPTRSEGMMQDYAKYLSGDKVGFTNFSRLEVFSPVKNNRDNSLGVVKNGLAADSMPTGEFDRYQLGRTKFANAGVAVNAAGNQRVVHGIPLNDGAKIVFSPSFAITQADVSRKVKGGSISDNSVVDIDGEQVALENVIIDGTLIVKTAPGVSLALKDVTVNNKGWRFVDLTDEEMKPENQTLPQYIQWRGYKIEKDEQLELVITEPGQYEFRSDNKVYRFENGQWLLFEQVHAGSALSLINSIGEHNDSAARRGLDYIEWAANLPEAELEKIRDAIADLSPNDREQFEARRASLIAQGIIKPAEPRAKDENVGGIDFNPDNIKMEINKQNGGINVEFDPKLLEEIRSQGIEGFIPVILNIQRVTDVLPLLSQNKNEDNFQTANI